MATKDLPATAAWKFIILVGAVSLCSDLTYEGARSISGPFLGTLQAGAVVVGVVAGLGEFIGYARAPAGRLPHRPHGEILAHHPNGLYPQSLCRAA
jgi:hypothetical protein